MKLEKKVGKLNTNRAKEKKLKLKHKSIKLKIGNLQKKLQKINITSFKMTSKINKYLDE